MIENSPEGRPVRIQARSHFTLGIGGLLTLIVTLSGLTLLLALVATFYGYWPVLAIAVLQVMLLGMILVRAWKSAWTVETITVGPDSICVLQEKYAERSRETFETAWARVILRPPAIRWYPPAVWLKSGGNRVELGAYLNTTERCELAEALRAAIARHSAWQHQKIETEVS
ncbi:MAG: DUF2244 domain-containing protein [Xanthomonadales bacterium]|nr:DUF2244 domain-containing protein [Xanthomonadales bacterium]